MSTPIQNNSEGLQRILQKVNSLPSGGGSGAAIQKASGSFAADDNGEATVTCGFQPDLVIVFAPEENEDGSFFHMAFPFGETGEYLHYSQSEMLDGIMYVAIGRTQNGFEVWMVNVYSFDWEKMGPYTDELSYLALKYN